MRTIWTWLKRAAVGVYAAIAGVFGGGGNVIADRKDMYGEGPAAIRTRVESDPRQRS